MSNFDSENQLSVKKTYFITIEIDLIEKEITISDKDTFLNESNVKFLQVKQDTLRQKHEKR